MEARGFLDECQAVHCPPTANGMCEWPRCAPSAPPEKWDEISTAEEAGWGELDYFDAKFENDCAADPERLRRA